MFRVGTPTDRSPPIISLTNSGEEQHAGAPDGLIFTPTTSFGSTNFANAASVEFSPVNSFNPRSSISCTIGCETRLSTIARASATSTTRPGNNPGIPKGDFLPSGASRTSIGGACGRPASSVPNAGIPPKSSPALPTQVLFTNVLRSMPMSAPDLFFPPNPPDHPGCKFQLTPFFIFGREGDNHL